VVGDHQQVLARLGSQFFYSQLGKSSKVEDCGFALVRFSQAIELSCLTREVFFFYSPHKDLQIRTFRAAKQTLAGLEREVTPDMMFLWSPDVRLSEELGAWSLSGKFLTIPLDLPDDGDPPAFIKLLRDYVFKRNIFYETTPVQGDRFFGRRRPLQTRNSLYAEIVSAILVAPAAATGLMTQATGDGLLAPVAKHDVARCAATCLLRPESHVGAVYEITGAELLSFADIARIDSEVHGVPIKYVPVSADERFAF
jgi:hypothetical protein